MLITSFPLRSLGTQQLGYGHEQAVHLARGEDYFSFLLFKFMVIPTCGKFVYLENYANKFKYMY